MPSSCSSVLQYSSLIFIYSSFPLLFTSCTMTFKQSGDLYFSFPISHFIQRSPPTKKKKFELVKFTFCSNFIVFFNGWFCSVSHLSLSFDLHHYTISSHTAIIPYKPATASPCLRFNNNTLQEKSCRHDLYWGRAVVTQWRAPLCIPSLTTPCFARHASFWGQPAERSAVNSRNLGLPQRLAFGCQFQNLDWSSQCPSLDLPHGLTVNHEF
jgi:hypothetical protein